MEPNLKNILDKLANLKVIVIGEAILDCYLEGFSEHVLIDTNVPSFTVNNCGYFPGGAANTAVNIRALGSDVTFISVIGDDRDGVFLKKVLSEHDVSTARIFTVPGRQTIVKQRVIASSQILFKFNFGTINIIDSITEQLIIDELEQRFSECDAVIISDYGYGILTEKIIHTLAQLQKYSPRILVVDSKNLTKYSHIGVTVVKPNYEQVVQLLAIRSLKNENKEGNDSRAEQITVYKERILELTGTKIAAVTLDAEGAIIFQQDSLPYRTYSQPTIPSRTVGAGDTYISAFTLALVTGATTETAANFAAVASTVAIAKDGTTACSAEEIGTLISNGLVKTWKDKEIFSVNTLYTKLLHSQHHITLSQYCQLNTFAYKHLSSTEELLAKIICYRKTKMRIVFTNGCFDILHAGHVSHLHQARTLGDILIIGVNSDDSIRRIKGVNRPINNLENRIKVLSALGYVDHVVVFDEDTPVNLIYLIKPDIYVKGGDYTEKTLPEASMVKKLGGVVKVLPYVENFSTTQLVKQIKTIA
jgi:D-beta-D-heptose 7-phosphate kinase / D-beta-D-heptose 1-phosphate adenosyltransferase